MKRTFQFLALVAISSAMMVSCKNKQSEPISEDIQAQKVALADSVLAQIDALYEEYEDASAKGYLWGDIVLTEEEKIVKPDYLLEPLFASTLATKSQKVNALAFYLADLPIRKMYDMQVEEVKEAIVKLAIELNHPIDFKGDTYSKTPVSEIVRKEYEACRERGDLTYFWQFQNAILRETEYLLSKNADLFLNKISDAQVSEFDRRWDNFIDAVKVLAEYDDEMRLVLNTIYLPSNREEFDNMYYSSKEAAAEMYRSNKFQFIERRNALLQ